MVEQLIEAPEEVMLYEQARRKVGEMADRIKAGIDRWEPSPMPAEWR